MSSDLRLEPVRADSPAVPVMLDDETLRDGLQSPSVRCPTIDEKIRILHLIDRLGIDTANIGLPGAGPQVAADVERLAREIADQRLARAGELRGADGDRRHQADRRDLAARRHPDRVLHVHRIEPAAAVRRGLVARRAAEADRGSDRLRGRRRAAGDVRHRGHDPRRSRLAAAAVLAPRSAPARSGSASPTPSATPRRPARPRSCASSATVLDECGGGVGIDWHGHRDRDFAIANSLAALEAGATRLHGAAIGIGERVGNTPMDTLLVNLVLIGYLDRDLTALVEYCETVSAATGVADPAELSRRRPRRVPDGDRRPRRRGDQGLPQGRSRSGRRRLLGRARRRWSGAARRSRSGRCRANRTSSSGWRSAAWRPDADVVDRIFAHAKGVGVGADGGGNPEAYRAWPLRRFSMAGSAARSTSPTAWKLFALSLSIVSCGVCHGSVFEIDQIDRRARPPRETGCDRPRSASLRRGTPCVRARAAVSQMIAGQPRRRLRLPLHAEIGVANHVDQDQRGDLLAACRPSSRSRRSSGCRSGCPDRATRGARPPRRRGTAARRASRAATASGPAPARSGSRCSSRRRSPRRTTTSLNSLVS